jgi:DNA-directed RNA polymerase specialized sigma24 family protein
MMALSLAESLARLQSPERRHGASASLVLEALRKSARRAALGRMVSPADEQDLAQDALVRVLETHARFRGCSDCEARRYLSEIVRRLALDGLRRKARARRNEPSLAHWYGDAWVAASDTDVHFAAELRSGLEKTSRALALYGHPEPLVDALDRLGMLGWTAFGCMSEAELAAVIGARPNAVQARRSRLRRAVQRTVEALLAQGALHESEANAVLTVVAPERSVHGPGAVSGSPQRCARPRRT